MKHYKCIAFFIPLLATIVISIIGYFYNSNTKINVFLVNNTLVILSIILGINGAICVQIYSLLLDRAEKNAKFRKHYLAIKKELRANMTFLIILFFTTITLILLQMSFAQHIYIWVIAVENFIFIYTIILSAFMLWEMVCFYGLEIPPSTIDSIH